MSRSIGRKAIAVSSRLNVYDYRVLLVKSDRLLGGGIVKKRVGLPGRGKSGGARTLVATNKAQRWFFLFGFEKNDRANVSAKELEALQAIAADLLQLNSAALDTQVQNEAIQEICHDCQDPRD